MAHSHLGGIRVETLTFFVMTAEQQMGVHPFYHQKRTQTKNYNISNLKVQPREMHLKA